MIAGLVWVIVHAKVLVTNNIHTQLYVLTEFSNNRDPRTGDCTSFQFHYMTMNYNKSHSTLELCDSNDKLIIAIISTITITIITICIIAIITTYVCALSILQYTLVCLPRYF